MMTVEKFRSVFQQERTCIHVKDVRQRGLVLAFLKDIGYLLGTETRKSLPNGARYNDSEFMYPTYVSFSSHNVSLYRDPPGTTTIEYEEISHLFEEPELLPEPEFFDSAIQILFS